MSNNRIRVGIVGAGANTRTRHIPGLQAIDGVEIAGVVNRSRDSSQQVARDFGIPRVYNSWSELVADAELDGIVIGTWPYLHARVTIAALEAGKHVLCEARMAMNTAEARAMRAAAQGRPGLVAQLVPSPFTLRVDAEVRQRIADGYLGDLLAIDVRDGNAFLDRSAPLHWRQDADLSGYNTLTMGIWYEALLRWVGEATCVNAMGKTFARLRRDQAGNMRAVRVPEHVDIIADMACGAQAHLQFSAVTGLADPPYAALYGSAGTLRFSENRLYGAQRGEPKLTEINIPPERQSHWRVEEEWINAIRGIEEVRLTTFDQGVKYMEFTEAVARSMATGHAVALPLLT
jgi:predicted dehydrogenase